MRDGLPDIHFSNWLQNSGSIDIGESKTAEKRDIEDEEDEEGHDSEDEIAIVHSDIGDEVRVVVIDCWDRLTGNLLQVSVKEISM